MKTLKTFIALFVLTLSAAAQRHTLYRPCPSSTTPAILQIERDGDIQITPCSGRSVFVGATTVTNATTASAVIADNAVVRGDGGARAVQTSTVTIDDNGGIANTLTNAATVGNVTTLAASATGNALEVRANGGGLLTNITKDGYINIATNGQFQINGLPVVNHNNASGFVGLNVGGPASSSRIGGSLVFLGDANLTSIDGSTGKASFNATNTAGGTTGAQTINKPSGTVNFAAGTATLVVTNSTVTTASLVFAVVRTADATALIKNVVPAAGSFTITLNANATAETSVGFVVFN